MNIFTHGTRDVGTAIRTTTSLPWVCGAHVASVDAACLAEALAVALVDARKHSRRDGQFAFMTRIGRSL